MKSCLYTIGPFTLFLFATFLRAALPSAPLLIINFENPISSQSANSLDEQGHCRRNYFFPRPLRCEAVSPSALWQVNELSSGWEQHRSSQCLTSQQQGDNRPTNSHVVPGTSAWTLTSTKACKCFLRIQSHHFQESHQNQHLHRFLTSVNTISRILFAQVNPEARCRGSL